MWYDGEDEVQTAAAKPDLDLIDLAERRWVRFHLPVMVCVDTDEAGDQWVSHVVPLLDDLELDRDREHVVYDPDGIDPIVNYLGDDLARAAVSYAEATQDAWIGQRPYIDWDWSDQPEILTAEDRDVQSGDEDLDEDEDGDDDAGCVRSGD